VSDRISNNISNNTRSECVSSDTSTSTDSRLSVYTWFAIVGGSILIIAVAINIYSNYLDRTPSS